MKKELGGLVAEEDAGAVGVSMVYLKGTGNSGERGRKIRQDSGHANHVGLSGHILEREGLSDGFLVSG